MKSLRSISCQKSAQVEHYKWFLSAEKWSIRCSGQKCWNFDFFIMACVRCFLLQFKEKETFHFISILINGLCVSRNLMTTYNALVYDWKFVRKSSKQKVVTCLFFSIELLAWVSLGQIDSEEFKFVNSCSLDEEREERFSLGFCCFFFFLGFLVLT